MHFKVVFYKKRRLLIILIILLAILVEGYAQQKKNQYVITDIHYDIKGLVTIAALEGKLDLHTNVKFDTLDALIFFVTEKRTTLSNLRALTEMSTIVFTHTWNNIKLQYDVEIFVYVTAGWNVLILPYFKYSDSTGLLLSMRGRDYNFLGSLETLYVNLDYGINEDSAQELGGSLGFQYPFKYNKNLFKLGVEEGAAYKLEEKEFNNNLKVFLGHSYPITQQVSLNSYLSQKFSNVINDDRTALYEYMFGENIVRYGMGFQLNRQPISGINNINYNPYLQYRLTYPFYGNDPDLYKRFNHWMTVGHDIGIGGTAWITGQFFRRGYSVSLENANQYDVYDAGWTVTINAEARAHFAVKNIFGMNFRLYGIQNYFLYSNNIDLSTKGTNFGEKLRGVTDDEVEYSQSALVLNTELMIRLFQIRPLAEFHFGPFFDVGLRSRNPENTVSEDEFYGNEDIKYTVGFEGLAFALFSNSIVIRVSYGIDLGKLLESDGKYTFLSGGVREIFIGLSLFY